MVIIAYVIGRANDSYWSHPTSDDQPSTASHRPRPTISSLCLVSNSTPHANINGCMFVHTRQCTSLNLHAVCQRPQTEDGREIQARKGNMYLITPVQYASKIWGCVRHTCPSCHCFHNCTNARSASRPTDFFSFLLNSLIR